MAFQFESHRLPPRTFAPRSRLRGLESRGLPRECFRGSIATIFLGHSGGGDAKKCSECPFLSMVFLHLATSEGQFEVAFSSFTSFRPTFAIKPPRGVKRGWLFTNLALQTPPFLR